MSNTRRRAIMAQSTPQVVGITKIIAPAYTSSGLDLLNYLSTVLDTTKDYFVQNTTVHPSDGLTFICGIVGLGGTVSRNSMCRGNGYPTGGYYNLNIDPQYGNHVYEGDILLAYQINPPLSI